MPAPWSDREIIAILTDYFDMLAAEIRGEPVNKTAHRRALQPRLHNRTESSIEWKHQNISAVLHSLGLPGIRGYRPAVHAQQRLRELAGTCLRDHPVLELMAADIRQGVGGVPEIDDILAIRCPPPPHRQRSAQVRGQPLPYARPSHQAPVDFLQVESANHELGQAGESLVLDYERQRLASLDRPSLADRVEQVSVTRGHWAGFDIRSFEDTGKDRFIEVKTTRYGIYTPFYISRAELEFSERHTREYQVYRVFDFRTHPRLFQLPGSVRRSCDLRAVTYTAWP